MRQGCGGAYLITVQQVIEKKNIQQTKLLLKYQDILEDGIIGHNCNLCKLEFTEEIAEIYDCLLELEEKISIEDKMSLFHIAGYVSRKDVPSDEDLFNVTTFYAERYGGYTNELDRGHLNIPDDKCTQWTFLCYIMFTVLKDKVCRKSLSEVFDELSDDFGFGMKTYHSRTLSNVLLNNFCKVSTPRDSKQSSSVKIAKLSD